ncbi:MAG: hypothetical protein HDQ91_03720 [Desulfovibrio sp.]|nr:hypothetical protein [Desulfovibrio sp.]
MQRIIELSASSARIRIRFIGQRLGPDLLAQIIGGSCHIGCVALAPAGGLLNALSAPGHRESELACEAASRLRDALKCGVAVIAGIHYDRITGSEIEIVRKLSLSLVEEYIQIQERSRNADPKGSGRI